MVSVGILVLFLISEESFQSFSFHHMSNIRSGLVLCSFIFLRDVSSVPNLLRVFTMNGCWILSIFFLYHWNDHIFFFHSVKRICHISWGFPGGTVVKNPPTMLETQVWSPGWDDSPGGGNGNPIQYSCLGKCYGQSSLVGNNPWGQEESAMTRHLSICITFIDCVYWAILASWG